MQTLRPTSRARSRGVAMIAALAMVTILMALAVAFLHTASTHLQMSANFRGASAARFAAESGLDYVLYRLRGCRSEGVVNGMPDMLQGIRNHLAVKITACPVSLVEADLNTPRAVVGGPVTLPGGESFSFLVYETDLPSAVEDPNQYEEGEVPPQIQCFVTGQSGGLSRAVGVRFHVSLNKEILHYAVSSTCRIIARGNVRVHGPVSSSYHRFPHPTNGAVRNNSVYPLDVSLGANGFIDGSLGVTMSQEEFEGDCSQGDTNFYNGVDGDLHDRVVFDEPEEVMNLRPEDFDTSPLKAMTSTGNLPSADSGGNTWEDWGTDPNSPTRPALENILVPKGTNPIFRNCTFKGITYIEVDEQTGSPTSGNQNYVQFIDCTFEGPIITGVPRKMDWNKNKMTFSGNTTFRPSMIQEALGGVTLMAPNFNVNIGGDEGGGGDGESYVVGLLIGGCVDLYNNLTVHGTVVSMAQLVNDGQCIMNKADSWVATTGVCGANLGNLSGSGSEIDIYPDAGNVLPLGIKRRFTPILAPSSYEEFTP